MRSGLACSGCRASSPASSRASPRYAFLAGVTDNATWCIPLSSFERDSKWDWLVSTASTVLDTNATQPQPGAYATHIFDTLFYFANTTSSRFPLSDHPSCTGPVPPVAAADRARPVLGAFFAPLLVAQPTEDVKRQWMTIRRAGERAGWWQA